MDGLVGACLSTHHSYGAFSEGGGVVQKLSVRKTNHSWNRLNLLFGLWDDPNHVKMEQSSNGTSRKHDQQIGWFCQVQLKYIVLVGWSLKFKKHLWLHLVQSLPGPFPATILDHGAVGDDVWCDTCGISQGVLAPLLNPLLNPPLKHQSPGPRSPFQTSGTGIIWENISRNQRVSPAILPYPKISRASQASLWWLNFTSCMLLESPFGCLMLFVKKFYTVYITTTGIFPIQLSRKIPVAHRLTPFDPTQISECLHPPVSSSKLT